MSGKPFVAFVVAFGMVATLVLYYSISVAWAAGS